MQQAGELEIVVDEQTRVRCRLVLMSEWKIVIPAMLNLSEAGADTDRLLAL